jgi:hypothetical protein
MVEAVMYLLSSHPINLDGHLSKTKQVMQRPQGFTDCGLGTLHEASQITLG